ncbi:hypothetical protein [Brevibacillus massiliensis]|nr:hypothetical protein [Brevibacillus massiliensis]
MKRSSRPRRKRYETRCARRKTMTGANGKTVTVLPLDDWVDLMKRYKRL